MSDDLRPRPESDPDPLARLIDAARALTPARTLVGRVGSSYRTSTQLDLREDHAAAVDAVHAEIRLDRDFPRDFLDRWAPVEVSTRARDRAEYLLRPDLGRRLDDDAGRLLAAAPRGVDVQVAIGDGLSAAAVAAQVPGLLPILARAVEGRGWSLGRPFFIRNCRVGVLNEIGGLLDPKVVVLLIGERPGLATAESLSAYLAHRPRPGHDDSDRNLISNIHARGTSWPDAAERIVALAARMIRDGLAGVALKDDGPDAARPGLGRP